MGKELDKREKEEGMRLERGGGENGGQEGERER